MANRIPFEIKKHSNSVKTSTNRSNKTIILVPLVLILVPLVFKKVPLVFWEFCVVRLVFGSPGFETLNPTLVETLSRWGPEHVAQWASDYLPGSIKR